MKRILISAYGCEPGKGSEQGVGWHWSLQLARFAEVVVLTRSNNRAAIEAAIPDEVSGRVCFEYYDLPPSLLRYKGKVEKGLVSYYFMWQWGAYRRARSLIQQSRFDFVMALTFGTLWLPTFMYLLPVPFIWGPVGGGEAVPFNLIKTLPIRSRLSQYLRYFLMATVPVNPFLLGPLRRAKVILTRTEDTARVIPRPYSHKVRVVLETAIADDFLARTRRLPTHIKQDSLRVIYTGRLVALKNVASAIHSIAHAKTHGVDVKFVIVGDGPLRESLEGLVVRLGVEGQVIFLGSISQTEVIEELVKSDVYLYPSLKEGGVWSLMEAMSVGLPIVCVNTSGMAVITDENSAIRVSPDSQGQMIADFARALVELAQSPELRRNLGANARKRIEGHFRWHHKAEFMRGLFDELERQDQ